MRGQIDLKAGHLALVRAILCAHLPKGAKVWVFGSRATGKARRGSDLDLAIDIGQKCHQAWNRLYMVPLNVQICPGKSILLIYIA